MNKGKTILKVIVGSHAHGLVTPNSDIDYRGVFVQPTSEILRIGGTAKNTHAIQGIVDDTMWEIGHFLNYATKCNPTILETFLAPVHESDLTGELMRDLFPYVWNATGVKNAFIGYGIQQRDKFIKKQDTRAPKYAAAYLRTLYNAYELLTTGTFTIRIIDTEVGETVKRFKENDFTIGEVIEICQEWKEKVDNAYENGKFKNKESDIEKINDFLLEVRKRNWQ